MKPIMKLSVIILGCLLLVSAIPGNTAASEMEILLNKLVEKGVLSETEGKAILQETREEAKKEQDQTIQRTKQALLTGDPNFKLAVLPAWVQKMTLTGDFRLRYEYMNRENTSDRNMGRYRLRLGVITKINDNFTVGFGLASGSSNPRSTMQTMRDTFESPNFWLDYAYVQYKPNSWLTLLGGKFKNPIWRVGDMLWDSDIRPEGVTAKMTCNPSDNLSLFLNTGFWVVDEDSGDSNDPTMFVIQPGMSINITDSTVFKASAIYYGFLNVEGADLSEHSQGMNTRVGGVLRHDYDSMGLTAELGMVNPFGTELPYLAFFADYINNIEVSNEDTGYFLGFKFGAKKVKEKGQWQVKYNYRRLETDAWLDTWPDSDAYGGTNAKGHEIIFQYGLCKNINVAFDYYRMENINGDNRSQDHLQIDLNVKF